MNRNQLPVVVTLTCFIVLCGTGVASAQLSVPAPPPPPTVATNFTFSVPFALTVSHPCQAGLVLIQGAVNVDLTTVASQEFGFELNATALGTGERVDAAGVPVSGETPYEFDAAAGARAAFPNGKPAFFAHTLTLDSLLTRPGTDRFALSTVLELEYNLGVPSAPKIQSIDVSCQ